MNFITLKMPVGADGKLSVDAKLRHDLNCELALITAVSVVTTLLRRTRLKQLNMNALVEQDRTLLKFRAREQ